MKVSIIIYYNEDRGWLKDSISSVKHQTFLGEIELIQSKGNGNASQNLNAGIKVATGDFIKYLSEDDELTTNSIQDSVNAFTEDVDFIHGNAFNFKTNSNGIKSNTAQYPRLKTPTLVDMLQNNVIHGGTVMYRRSFFEKYGLFDENLVSAEEYDLHLRAMKNGAKLGYCNSFLYYYRRHDNQKSLGKGIDQVARAKYIDSIKARHK